MTNTFQDIVLTSPESAVSSTLYSTVTLTFDFLTPSLSHNASLHRWRKFGDIVSNTLQDIMLTMSRDAYTEAWIDGRMDACTDKQD